MDVRSRVRVNDQYSEEFGFGVGVHQGSAQRLAFHTCAGNSFTPVPYWYSVPWEPLYADDRLVMTDYGPQGTESLHEEDEAYGLGAWARPSS